MTSITDTVSTSVQAVGTLDTHPVSSTDQNTKTTTLTSDVGTITLQPNKDSSIALQIPASTTVSGTNAWDGTIAAPVIRKQTDSTIFIQVGSPTSNLQFSTPVNIVVKTSLPEGTTIDIYSSEDGNTWSKQGRGTVINGIIVITTTHFSYFALTTVLKSS